MTTATATSQAPTPRSSEQTDADRAVSVTTAGIPASPILPWAGRTASPEQITAWLEAFHRDGYVFIPNVLPADRCAQLREDLDRISPPAGGPTELACRMFEQSRANLDLFDLEPIVTLAETIIGEDRNLGKESCHVMHNNSFRTIKGGGFSHWHQDDSPHFLVTSGEAPTNIHLPCLLLTCNYYLTDQPTALHGPAQVVPGSHKFGKICPDKLEGTPYESQILTCGGGIGSLMVFNNQVWHRGAPNHSDRVRYVTQISYARKLVGHKYAPFMNYHLPDHCLEGAHATAAASARLPAQRPLRLSEPQPVITHRTLPTRAASR